MKLFYVLAGIVTCCCSFSNCDGENYSHCDAFKEDLVFLSTDPVYAKSEVNYLLHDLTPSPTATDELGHEMNFAIFVDRLKSDCFPDATIGCYACIETLPVQSEVIIKLDSAGTQITRLIDIQTPADSVMTFLDIH